MKFVKRRLRRALKKAKRSASSRQIDTLYAENDYLEAYSKHTDIRVDADSQSAIGGQWEEIGKLQFQFLVGKNLQPHHKMLDIGCGTLRGGRHFITYLEPSNYYGIDISPKAIDAAKQLVQQEGLAEKTPHLLVSVEKNLKFAQFAGEQFDYILAQSVFTHLMPEHITECFEHIGSIMGATSAFYFTYKHGEAYAQTGAKDFRYPFSFFDSLAEQYGFQLQDCSADYPHPRNQIMVEARLR